MRPHSAVLGHSLRTRPYCDRALSAPWSCPAAGAVSGCWCYGCRFLSRPACRPTPVTGSPRPHSRAGPVAAHTRSHPPARRLHSTGSEPTTGGKRFLPARIGRPPSAWQGSGHHGCALSYLIHQRSFMLISRPEERSSEEGRPSRAPWTSYCLQAATRSRPASRSAPCGSKRSWTTTSRTTASGQRPRKSRTCQSSMPHGQLVQGERTFPACICGSMISACVPAGSVREQQ